jgi:hypothetical protein
LYADQFNPVELLEIHVGAENTRFISETPSQLSPTLTAFPLSDSSETSPV